MKEKVVLAYSGGLDTTAIIPWLKENFDYEVICVCIDCGQAEELDSLEERAKFCGAEKLYILNVIEQIFPSNRQAITNTLTQIQLLIVIIKLQSKLFGTSCHGEQSLFWCPEKYHHGCGRSYRISHGYQA